MLLLSAKGLLLCLVAILQIAITSSFSAKSTTKVAVVGADTEMGRLVFERLLRKKNCLPIALVQQAKAVKQLQRDLNIDKQFVQFYNPTIDNHALADTLQGVDQVVLCATALAKPRLWFRLKNFLRRLVNKQRSPRPAELYYPKGKSPYEVDYVGNKRVIDECVRAGVEHVVLLGAMGGYRDHQKSLEKGKVSGEDDNKNSNNNIFKYRRALERYLMKRRFFTILHAARLTDESGGRREVIWDVDDALLRTEFRSIPKEDAAEVVVQALFWKEAVGRSIDIAAGPSKGSAKQDWLRFWSRPGNCVYPSE